MNSQPTLFDSQTAASTPRGELVLSLEIDGRLPSWNEILGMEHWARAKFKSQLQAQFLSSLRAIAADCSTLTTSQKSITLIACVTLASYLAMVQAKRKLKRDKKRSEKKSVSLFESKSSVPF